MHLTFDVRFGLFRGQILRRILGSVRFYRNQAGLGPN